MVNFSVKKREYYAGSSGLGTKLFDDSNYIKQLIYFNIKAASSVIITATIPTFSVSVAII